MILKSFTWQHFIVATLVLGIIWYVGIWLWYRRKGKKPIDTENSSTPLPHRWQKQVDELSPQDDLIGQPTLEPGVQIVEAADFSFADKSDTTGLADKSHQLGLVPDVLGEIKSICAILEQKDGNKEDFFAMFEMVKVKYPKIIGYPTTSELNQFIREHVPFHLSDEELEGLWN